MRQYFCSSRRHWLKIERTPDKEPPASISPLRASLLQQPWPELRCFVSFGIAFREKGAGDRLFGTLLSPTTALLDVQGHFGSDRFPASLNNNFLSFFNKVEDSSTLEHNNSSMRPPHRLRRPRLPLRLRHPRDNRRDNRRRRDRWYWWQHCRLGLGLHSCRLARELPHCRRYLSPAQFGDHHARQPVKPTA